MIDFLNKNLKIKKLLINLIEITCQNFGKLKKFKQNKMEEI